MLHKIHDFVDLSTYLKYNILIHKLILPTFIVSILVISLIMTNMTSHY